MARLEGANGVQTRFNGKIARAWMEGPERTFAPRQTRKRDWSTRVTVCDTLQQGVFDTLPLLLNQNQIRRANGPTAC